MAEILFLLMLIGGGAAASNGGGSGSGNSQNSISSGGSISHWQNTISQIEIDDYTTEEYNEQYGLVKIHAAEAYALLEKNNKNNSGENVIVAIAESGAQLNHSELATATAGINHYLNSTNPINQSHGTHVASIIAAAKNDSGMHGVAYNSKIFVLGALDISQAVNNGAKVLNMSFGDGAFEINSAGYNNAKNIYQNNFDIAVNNDILMTAATGNNWSSYMIAPAIFAQDADFVGYMIAVNLTDALNNDSFGNQCRQAKDYCLTAPGYGIYAAIPVDNYARQGGTSMSAPHVSGAAAVLRGAWPHLTAPQVSHILFSTATDLGAPGTDDIYGRGLLNLYAAVQAQGSNNFSYGAYVSQSYYDIRQSSMAIDPIFGDAFITNVASALKDAVFFDDYGRDYKAFFNEKITQKTNYSFAGSSRLLLSNTYKYNTPSLSFDANSKLKLQIKSYANNLAERFSNIDKSVDSNDLSKSDGFSFTHKIDNKNGFSFAFNVDEVTNLNSKNFDDGRFISTRSIAANPYQYFISSQLQNLQNNSSQTNFHQLFFDHQYSKNLKLNFSYQSSYQSSSIFSKNRTINNQITDIGFSYQFNQKTNLLFSVGNLQEFNNNFLNSQALGAFESGNNSKTSYAKIALNKNLFGNISLFTSLSQGVTQIKGNDLGIFRDYKNIRSQSSAVGFIANKIFNGKFGIAYSKPLRVYSGKTKIDIPIARDNAGNVTRYVSDISLVPQGKQRDLEFSYSKALANDSYIALNFVISKDLGNIKNNNARVGFINYSTKF